MVSRNIQSRPRFFILPFVFLLFFILSGCDKDSDIYGNPDPDQQTQDDTLATGDNQPPNAKITAPQTSISGQTISLDGSGSSDPDDEILSYQWVQTKGPNIALSDSTSSSPTFVAPSVAQTTQFSFELTVNDGELSNSATVSVQISPVADNTGPSIVSRSPQPDQSGVLTTAEISVGFAEALLETSIDSQSFSLSQNGSPVSGVVSYDSDNNTITIKPASPLSPDTTYRVTLGNSLEDLAGNAFAGDSWNFFTSGGTVGVTGVCGDGEIDIEAGEDCDDHNTITETCPSGVESCTICDANCNEIKLVPDAVARNVILIIGDGMGPEIIRAGGMYAYGEAGTLSFEAFPYKGQVTNHSLDSKITDSAAASTAMATGYKTKNGTLGQDGDGNPFTTILESAAAAGMRTGLVTTTFITHATPAAFASHVSSRNKYEEIGKQYFTDTKPDLLLGGARYVSPDQAKAAGYRVVKDRQALMNLPLEASLRLSGQFGDDHLPYELDGVGDLPHLSDMAEVALAALESSERGFFLMIEGGRIDHASHKNDIDRALGELLELDATVRTVQAWAEGRHDTLILVTADHETGGLEITANNGEGVMPSVNWDSKGHTATPVPVFGWGVGADLVPGLVDNTDIYQLLFTSAGSPGTDGT